ncbi:MAG: hypothetical protein ACODAJ_01185 [Planctomycetota bacterium]
MDDEAHNDERPEPEQPEAGEPEAEEAAADETILPQLVAILTARWRQDNGRLAVGAPKRRIREALRVEGEELEFLLHKLADQAEAIGLELRDYRRSGDTWLCLTAVHGGPSELRDREQGVLGLLVHLVRKSGRRRSATMDEIREILVGREYLTEHQLQTVLRQLDYMGYIRRSRGTVHLDCRTALEFDDAAQKEIAEQAKTLIL